MAEGKNFDIETVDYPAIDTPEISTLLGTIRTLYAIGFSEQAIRDIVSVKLTGMLIRGSRQEVSE